MSSSVGLLIEEWLTWKEDNESMGMDEIGSAGNARERLEVLAKAEKLNLNRGHADMLWMCLGVLGFERVIQGENLNDFIRRAHEIRIVLKRYGWKLDGEERPVPPVLTEAQGELQELVREVLTKTPERSALAAPTPPRSSGTGTTPPKSSGTGTTPPKSSGTGTTPPKSSGTSATPLRSSGTGTTPLRSSETGTTPPQSSAPNSSSISCATGDGPGVPSPCATIIPKCAGFVDSGQSPMMVPSSPRSPSRSNESGAWQALVQRLREAGHCEFAKNLGAFLRGNPRTNINDFKRYIDSNKRKLDADIVRQVEKIKASSQPFGLIQELLGMIERKFLPS